MTQPAIPPSEEVLRQEIAIDVILYCNQYAVALIDQKEPAASAAVQLMGQHLARHILEERCFPTYSSGSPTD